MKEKNNIQKIYPLTPMQEGMLFHTLHDDSNAYFTQAAYRCKGQIDLDVLEQSLDLLFQRHDILRTAFVYEKNERPIQVVLDNRRIKLQVTDIANLQEEDARAYIAACREEDITRGFDLVKDVLMRLTVLKMAGAEYTFIWSYHHMLMDGWCLPILLGELNTIYGTLVTGGSVNLPAPVPFARYIQWLEKQDKEAALKYWRNYLRDYETAAGIPPVLQPAAEQPYHSPRTAILRLTKEKTQQLHMLAKQQQVTLNVVFQALWGILLGRYNNTDDVVYGNVVSGRPADLPGVEDMLGLFINTVPLRIRFDHTTRFDALLQQVHTDAIESLSHHYCPLAEIQANSDLKRNLIQHIIAFENYPLEESIAASGPHNLFDVQNVEVFEQTNYNFDIDVELGETMAISIYYNPALYTEEYIARILRHFEQLADQALENVQAPVTEMELLTSEERNEQLNIFNQGLTDLDNTIPLNLRFEQTAALYPGQPAVIHGNTVWDYNMLNERSNRVAVLLQQQAVSPGDLVGVHMERTPELVAAILGILKCGAVYVPLDTQNPAARTQEMIESSGIRVLIDAAFMGKAEESVLPVQNPPNVNKMDSWAYMLYTSGSTGKPKGAITRHDGALNHMLAEFAALALPDGFRFLQSASIASDISVWQLLAPLMKGGAVVIIDKEDLLNYDKLLNILQQNAVTIAEFVPSYLLGLADYLESFSLQQHTLPALQWMMMVGEEVPAKLVNQWLKLFPGCKVLNGYGPCEASDDIAQYVITQTLEPGIKKVPIGRPIANMNIFILDKYNRLLPAGVPGELCVSGVGVGAGYWQEPEKTAAKFIPAPFNTPAGNILYKTGDLARWLPDGNLEFLGRIDNQVKIRGFRVELGEIEHCLQQHPAVQEAVVVMQPYQNELLPIAYIVPKTLQEGDALEQTKQLLRDHLREKLAPYMQPAEWLFMDRFPLNLSDKVDRKALPSPAEWAAIRKGVVPPANEMEAALLEIWQKILDKENISANDHFFDIGGHSLKATRLAAHINKRFNAAMQVRDVFACPTIQQQAAHIVSGTVTHTAIPVAPQEPSYPLSHAQQRLWVLYRLEEEGQYNYNMADAYTISGTVDVNAFSKAFAQLVDRHEILRTIFIEEQGTPRQQILQQDERFELQLEDLQTGASVHERVLAASMFVFDLAVAPLFKAVLLKVRKDEYVFVLVMHHIITDGWSSEILIRDLLQYYTAQQNAKAALPAPLPIQYKDYAVWHNRLLQQAETDKHRNYWMQQFNGEINVLDLPADYPRQAGRSQHGAVIDFELPAAFTTRLKALGSEKGVSLFMILLAGLKALLYRYTAQEDLVVGTSVAGREHSDLDDQAGFYVNTLALRTKFDGTRSFAALLEQVRQITLAAYEHQHYPFDQLVDDLALKRELDRSPLFDVMLALQNAQDADKLQYPGWEISEYPLEPEVSKFDLTIEVWETGNVIQGIFEYNTTLFAKARIQRMAIHYMQLLEAAVSAVDTPLYALDYLPATERREILEVLAGDPRRLPHDINIPEQFALIAGQYPQSLALADEQRSYTYAQLNREANQLAHCLRERYGIGEGDVVAVVMSRSTSFVLSMLAIIKSGAAYLPLEGNIPAERIRALTAQTKAGLLITDDPVLQEMLSADLPCVCIHTLSLDPYPAGQAPLTAVNGESLAYIMFTSGSTGQPKGVMIPHRGIIRLVKDTNYVNFTPDDRILQTGSLSFDAATYEIWGALLNGGQLHLMDLQHLLDSASLAKAIREKGITQMLLTTSWFNQLADADLELFRPLRHLLVGGEQMSPQHVQKVKEYCPQLMITNGYGPTENTTVSICGVVPEVLGPAVPLGRPVSWSTVYIVDRYLQLVPKGIPGELLLGGEGLSQGYIGDEARTLQQFIPHPFMESGKLYRSGDIGKWLPDGTVEFMGRFDDQVKINGYRVEPGEIANTVKTFEPVQDAFVLVESNPQRGKMLVCYYTAKGTLETEDLRGWLKELLPNYMIPALFVPLQQVPLNKNGKLDRNALPDINAILSKQQSGKAAPQDETETQLLAIWQEILGRKDIGTQDNFFEAGGNSLAATRITAKIQSAMQVNIGLAAFFRNPEINALAKLIRQTEQTTLTRIPYAPAAACYEMSRAQRRLWLANSLAEEKTAFNISGAFEISGDLDADVLEQAIGDTFVRHEILRTVFIEKEGIPYQQILETAACVFRLPVQQSTAQEWERQLQLALLAEEQHVFSLDQWPLARFQLVSGGRRHGLLLNLHHIIGDGWSMQILLEEILQRYEALISGATASLPALRIQYKDYAAWHNAQWQSQSPGRDETYWLSKLGGLTERPELPLDKIRARQRLYESSELHMELSADTVAQLKAWSAEQEVSLFMILQTLVKLLLWQYQDTDDVVIGTTVAGRNHPDLEQQLGFYVNVLVLATRLSAAEDFNSLLQKVKAGTLEAFEHQQYPFDLLVERIKSKRDLSRNPLFDVMLSYNDGFEGTDAPVSALQIKELESGRGSALNKYDLTFSFEHNNTGGMILSLIYNTSLFYESTIAGMKDSMDTLIKAVLQDAGATLEQLRYGPVQEKLFTLEDDFS